MFNDTICAIATGLTNSGISIIRVSGASSIDIVDSVFVNPSNKHILTSIESHTICYGFLLDGDEKLDEVMVSVFRAPRSFTAEDTVEINCHGGMFVTKRILDIIVKAGARLAEPGEFTKRAFLNGRIDLSKAEAVMDVICAESDTSLKASVRQLRGSVYQKIKDIRSRLIYEIAYIESALDDPEHISLEGFENILKDKLSAIINEIKAMLDSFDNGRILREGINTVILGKPNAGKSSLLNMLSGYDRAIVTKIPGTTRDIIEERIRLGQLVLNLIDTAGIRSTSDLVEQLGIDRALKSCDTADLIFYVVDSSVELDANDERIIDYIKDKQAIVIYNKSDLEPVVSLEQLSNILPNLDIIAVSTVDASGAEEIKNSVESLFNSHELQISNEVQITNVRQKNLLEEALHSLLEVIHSIDIGMSEDFLTIDLMDAYQRLGFIIGEEVSDDLVNEIFGKFCMGK